MDGGDAEESTTYLVLVNDEEQYSLWQDGKKVPKGWHAIGDSGPKADRLAWIKEHWTDMTPLSLRGVRGRGRPGS